MTIKLIVAVKGSAKSGNYGHGGRPGKVGGSMPKSGAVTGAGMAVAIVNTTTGPKTLRMKTGEQLSAQLDARRQQERAALSAAKADYIKAHPESTAAQMTKPPGDWTPDKVDQAIKTNQRLLANVNNITNRDERIARRNDLEAQRAKLDDIKASLSTIQTKSPTSATAIMRQINDVVAQRQAINKKRNKTEADDAKDTQLFKQEQELRKKWGDAVAQSGGPF